MIFITFFGRIFISLHFCTITMIVIPVMDLLNGQVVQGIGGKRKEYQPIQQSVVVDNAEPLNVANAFHKRLDLNWFYIADLDRIQKTANISLNAEKLMLLTEDKKFTLMVDGGCQTLDDMKKMLELNVNQIIIGTETLASINELRKAVRELGADRIILSLDFNGGKLFANNKRISKLTPLKIAKLAEKLALKAIIVLELQKVGSQTGPISDPLIEIASAVKTIPVFAGGGVRNIEDLLSLKKYNIAGALVATAIHKGTITKNDLSKL
ncbi:MAG: hypothetical protein FK734_12670 [Asgard group archaeon]|nr:hypothetical protein [Asgard group archaeon]